MTSRKPHGALNLLAEGLLRILQVKQNTDIADVDKALDFLHKSSPELLVWFNQRLTACLHRNLPTTEVAGGGASAKPDAGSSEANRAYRDHLARVLDHQTTLLGVWCAEREMEEGACAGWLRDHVRFVRKVVDVQRKIADGIRKLVP